MQDSLQSGHGKLAKFPTALREIYTDILYDKKEYQVYEIKMWIWEDMLSYMEDALSAVASCSCCIQM